MKRNPRKTGFVVAVVLIAVLAITGIAFAGGADKDSNDVFWWWGAPAGSSTIVRNDNGISGTYSASLSNAVASADGLAVTLWVVVFNDPGECINAPEPCVEADLFNPDVMADVLYGAGNVVDDSEIASFGFHRKAGDNSGSIATLFGMPTDNGQPFGLKYPRSAEIHYVLRTHGPKVPADMPAMIQTYGGGCIDFAPFGYLPPAGPLDLYLGLGQCQDVQFAINQ